MKKYPKVGDKIYPKGYEALSLIVADIDKNHKENNNLRPILTFHPISGMPFWWALSEIEEWNQK